MKYNASIFTIFYIIIFYKYDLPLYLSCLISVISRILYQL